MIAFVTGGAEGIGRGIVKEYIAQGHQVGFMDINEIAGQALVDELNSSSLNFFRGDIRDQSSIAMAMDETTNKYGPISTLVANAGVHRPNTILDVSDEDLDLVIGVNILGTIKTLREGVSRIKESGGGAVVIIASDQALIGKRNSFVYGLTKGAMGQITKSMALDLATYKIRVNAVCPGTIETPLVDRVFKTFADQYFQGDISEVQKADAAAHPLGRQGTPEEVAKLVYFLSSEKASFITGSLHSIDGGLTAG